MLDMEVKIQETRNRYKKTEKEITLAVTLKLGEYIEKNLPDLKVVYTRKGDTYPTLWQRVNIANGANADLFISIHCDAFTNSNAYGSGSYIMGLDLLHNLRMAKKKILPFSLKKITKKIMMNLTQTQ